MKLNSAIELGKDGVWKEAQIRVSPGNQTLWFVMLRDNQHKSFILADNNDTPVSSDDINELARLIKLLGLKQFTAFL